MLEQPLSLTTQAASMKLVLGSERLSGSRWVNLENKSPAAQTLSLLFKLQTSKTLLLDMSDTSNLENFTFNKRLRFSFLALRFSWVWLSKKWGNQAAHAEPQEPTWLWTGFETSCQGLSSADHPAQKYPAAALHLHVLFTPSRSRISRWRDEFETLLLGREGGKGLKLRKFRSNCELLRWN